MSIISRALRAFGRFWWEFLVGDTPELFVATAVIVAAAYGLRDQGDVGFVLVPALAVLFLVASAYRGRRRSADPP